jgi:hypothetical protein
MQTPVQVGEEHHMQSELETVIRAVRALSSHDKLALLGIIRQDLQQNHDLAAANTAFWSPRSLEQLLADQEEEVPIITDVTLLGAEFWPEDETADEVNDYIRQRRSEA